MIKTVIRLCSTALLATSVGMVSAATFPERAIKVVTPFPAGGATDVLTRVVTERMGQVLGQTMIVENRAGAATTIGASYAAREKADGYTVLMATNSTLVTNRFLFKELSYDPDKFEPIGMIGIGPMILLTNDKHKFNSTADVVKYAKAHPRELSIASFGAGTSSHLAAEHFQQLADVQMLHVPFKGSTQALPQLVNGDVDLFFDMVSTGMPQVNSGKLKALAITSKQRLTTLPQLPTLAEEGYDNYEITAWFSLVAPQDTPPAVLATLQKALQTTLQDETVVQKILNMGIQPSDGSPDSLVKQIRTEIPVIEALVIQADIAVQ